MKRFTALLVLGASLVVVGSAAAASAAQVTTTTVKWFSGLPDGCRDGTATVPAGDARVTFGWGTYSNYYTTQFMKIQYVTYTINGGAPVQTAVGDTTGWRLSTSKDQSGQKVYVAQYTSPVLATLASGQAVTVTFSLKTNETAYDNDTTPYPAGTELLGTERSCTITAA